MRGVAYLKNNEPLKEGFNAKVLGIVLCCAVFFSLVLPGSSQVQLPEGEGKEIVESTCTQCHGLDTVTNFGRSLEEWQTVLNDMVARGAPLLLEEIDTVAKYLAEHFGPEESSEGSSEASAPSE